MRIHYNVTGADRKALVKVIADATGAKAEYKGMPTCDYEIDYFTVTKEGVLEFDDRADSEEVEAVLEALGKAGFDGVGENVDPDEDEAPTGADTAPQGCEGGRDPIELTVSLPLARHTGLSLRNLINMLYTRAPLLNKALGTAFRVDERLVSALQPDANVLSFERFGETVATLENSIGKTVDGLVIDTDRLTFSTLPETDDPAVCVPSPPLP